MSWALMRAVRADDAEGVAKAVKAGAGPNAAARGVPILIDAIQGGHLRAAEALLAGGADPNAVGSDRVRPLCAAVRAGDEAVRLLLRFKPELDYDGRLNATPLMQACEWQAPKVVRLLLDAGADPEFRGRFNLLTAADQLVYAANNPENPRPVRTKAEQMLALFAEAGASVRSSAEVNQLLKAPLPSAVSDDEE